MYAALGIIAALCIFLVYIMRKARKDGRNEEKLSYSRETLNEIREAHKIRERVRSDSDYRDRVRKRFDK